MAIKIHGAAKADQTKEKPMAVSWLKTGEDSEKLAAQEKLAAEKRRAEQGKMYRFFLKKGEEARILFVDGDLSSNGYLTPPRYYEHFINFDGWKNIVCPQQTNPTGGEKCPICEGKDRPALVSAFTVIDLRPFTTKDGKVIPATRKLLVAKPQSFELLNKMAVKRGGLAGCVFDVSRIADKSPAIGDVFDFVEKMDVNEAKQKFTVSFKTKDGTEKTICLFEPAVYTNEIVYYTGNDLRKMGFGAPVTSVPFDQSGTTTAPEEVDYKEHL